ncbi:MAG: phosphohydrolase, partial [Ferruginibacter sp.]
NGPLSTVSLQQFCNVDDYDVMMAIKTWCNHEDQVLSTLSRGIIDRRLLKVKYYAEPVDENLVAEKIDVACITHGLTKEDARWLVFTGEASSSTYNFEDEHIHILFKDGLVKDISEVDNALINENLRGKVKKYYICYLR